MEIGVLTHLLWMNLSRGAVHLVQTMNSVLWLVRILIIGQDNVYFHYLAPRAFDFAQTDYGMVLRG